METEGIRRKAVFTERKKHHQNMQHDFLPLPKLDARGVWSTIPQRGCHAAQGSREYVWLRSRHVGQIQQGLAREDGRCIDGLQQEVLGHDPDISLHAALALDLDAPAGLPLLAVPQEVPGGGRHLDVACRRGGSLVIEKAVVIALSLWLDLASSGGVSIKASMIQRRR